MGLSRSISFRVVLGLLGLFLGLVVASGYPGWQKGRDSVPYLGYRPKEGFVPDESTAKAVAEAVLIPIYGRSVVAREKPLHATLLRGQWQINGTIPGSDQVPHEDIAGGTVEVRLSKLDGRVLFVSHGK